MYGLSFAESTLFSVELENSITVEYFDHRPGGGDRLGISGNSGTDWIPGR
ncbi:MAG: hypothetical protein L7V86_04805 [Verrucomicrobiales bacterium]|nr:hypothetical protein [Verrucomicrobiales bacterium]MDF1786611.1 hypothetical protein [Verrucomicrobiales bacterium]